MVINAGGGDGDVGGGGCDSEELWRAWSAAKPRQSPAEGLVRCGLARYTGPPFLCLDSSTKFMIHRFQLKMEVAVSTDMSLRQPGRSGWTLLSKSPYCLL